MSTIRKKIVLDEASNPIAVQIDYDDWLEIARRLGLDAKVGESAALERFAASIRLTEDPMKFQERVRQEWR